MGTLLIFVYDSDTVVVQIQLLQKLMKHLQMEMIYSESVMYRKNIVCT